MSMEAQVTSVIEEVEEEAVEEDGGVEASRERSREEILGGVIVGGSFDNVVGMLISSLHWEGFL